MLFRMFGIGVSAAIAGAETRGTVTGVTTCYWLKVNTTPVRTHPGEGARYPHIIRFTYAVDGREYTGRRWVSWNSRCPVKDEKITVHYEEAAPEKYAVLL